jgi:hypothetical protein
MIGGFLATDQQSVVLYDKGVLAETLILYSGLSSDSLPTSSLLKNLDCEREFIVMLHDNMWLCGHLVLDSV